MSNLETPSIIEKHGLWADLRKSITGSQHDFTSGSLGRAILLLSVPMVLEMLMQAVFEVADVFFVSKLGPEAVAAVGLTASLLILVFAVGIGLSMGAIAMVARRIGEKDAEGAADVAFQALMVAAGVAIPIALVGLFFAPNLLALMGGTPEVIDLGSGYLSWLFGSNIVILLLFLINAIFRGTGDAVYAMRALWLANGLNIILDPIFIFGWGPVPAYGVTGAAIATTIGRGIGVLYQLYLLQKGNGRISIGRRHMKLHPKIMRALLKISGPGVAQFLVGTASWVFLMWIVSGFGSASIAGYTIAVRIFVFALLPSWGIGNAAATLVGQNLGAQKPERSERAVWITGLINMIFLSGFGVVLYLFSEPLILLFTTEPDVVRVGSSCLRFISYSYPFFGYGMVTVQAFNGAGDTTTPTWINFGAYWLVQIPLAYTLAHSFSLHTDGVFIAISIAQFVLAMLGIGLFRRGRWKTRVV